MEEEKRHNVILTNVFEFPSHSPPLPSPYYSKTIIISAMRIYTFNYEPLLLFLKHCLPFSHMLCSIGTSVYAEEHAESGLGFNSTLKHNMRIRHICASIYDNVRYPVDERST